MVLRYDSYPTSIPKSWQGKRFPKKPGKLDRNDIQYQGTNHDTKSSPLNPGFFFMLFQSDKLADANYIDVISDVISKELHNFVI